MTLLPSAFPQASLVKVAVDLYIAKSSGHFPVLTGDSSLAVFGTIDLPLLCEPSGFAAGTGISLFWFSGSLVTWFFLVLLSESSSSSSF